MFGNPKCPYCATENVVADMKPITVGDGFAGPMFHGVAVTCANQQCQKVLSIIADPSALAADIAHRVDREIRGAKG